MAQRRRWLLALVALLIVAAATAIVFGFRGPVDVDALQAWVAGLGVWAPVGFVLLYAAATIVMVPGSVFDLAGGALFGPYLGSALDLAGGSLGATLAFLVGRYLARDWVETKAGPRLQKVMRSVDEEGWRAVAFLRLVPVFPYIVANYLLGVTRIAFSHYVLATVVFSVPSTVAYTWTGYASRQLLAGDSSMMRYGLIVLGLVAVLFVLPRFFKRLRRA